MNKPINDRFGFLAASPLGDAFLFFHIFDWTFDASLVFGSGITIFVPK